MAAYHRSLVWDIVKAPKVTRYADRVLNPLIGKSLVVYLAKPLQAADLSDAKPNLASRRRRRRGPTTPKQGAAA